MRLKTGGKYSYGRPTIFDYILNMFARMTAYIVYHIRDMKERFHLSRAEKDYKKRIADHADNINVLMIQMSPEEKKYLAEAYIELDEMLGNSSEAYRILTPPNHSKIFWPGISKYPNSPPPRPTTPPPPSKKSGYVNGNLNMISDTSNITRSNAVDERDFLACTRNVEFRNGADRYDYDKALQKIPAHLPIEEKRKIVKRLHQEYKASPPGWGASNLPKGLIFDPVITEYNKTQEAFLKRLDVLAGIKTADVLDAEWKRDMDAYKIHKETNLQNSLRKMANLPSGPYPKRIYNPALDVFMVYYEDGSIEIENKIIDQAYKPYYT